MEGQTCSSAARAGGFEEEEEEEEEKEVGGVGAVDAAGGVEAVGHAVAEVGERGGDSKNDGDIEEAAAAADGDTEFSVSDVAVDNDRSGVGGDDIEPAVAAAVGVVRHIHDAAGDGVVVVDDDAAADVESLSVSGTQSLLISHAESRMSPGCVQITTLPSSEMASTLPLVCDSCSVRCSCAGSARMVPEISIAMSVCVWGRWCGRGEAKRERGGWFVELVD